MTSDGAPALSRANVGIAVEGATDAARGAADIVLMEPSLSTIVHAIRDSYIIFERMRNYSIYACAVTIRIVVYSSFLVFTYKFKFPLFMSLVIALLSDGTIVTLSVDRVLPSMTPDSWDLTEIFSYAVAYGLYLTHTTSVCFESTPSRLANLIFVFQDNSSHRYPGDEFLLGQIPPHSRRNLAQPYPSMILDFI
jgi:H+-transporting ATPase